MLHITAALPRRRWLCKRCQNKSCPHQSLLHTMSRAVAEGTNLENWIKVQNCGIFSPDTYLQVFLSKGKAQQSSITSAKPLLRVCVRSREPL